MLSRLGRRGAALDLIEEIEDETVDSLDAASLPSTQHTDLVRTTLFPQ